MRTELSNVRVQNSFARAEISELRSKNARCGRITHWCGLEIDMRGTNIKCAGRILLLKFFKM